MGDLVGDFDTVSVYHSLGDSASLLRPAVGKWRLQSVTVNVSCVSALMCVILFGVDDLRSQAILVNNQPRPRQKGFFYPRRERTSKLL